MTSSEKILAGITAEAEATAKEIISEAEKKQLTFTMGGSGSTH